jgi:5-methylcytosine-specific restriction endonuclease McrA
MDIHVPENGAIMPQPGKAVNLIFAPDFARYGYRQGDGAMLLSEQVRDFSQQVLRTDVAGMPLEWIDYRDAVRLYHTEQVAYTCGTPLYRIYGGICAATGMRSMVEVNSIVATIGKTGGSAARRNRYIPPLNNKTLFRRDANLCMYCATPFMSRELTRDHIRPLSQGGMDRWSNVVTACRRCNNHKGGLTPEQAGMQLIAVPFTPTYAEYIYLKGRRVLADQMEFLLAHIPRTSPLHERLSTTLRDGT